MFHVKYILISLVFHVKQVYNVFHMKQFTSKTQKTGEIGEKIAEMFLVKHNFNIIEKNFTHKMGEIDIIATKENRLYFFEVKAIYKKTGKNDTVTRETYQKYPESERETSVKHFLNNQGHKNNIKDIKNVSNNQVKIMSLKQEYPSYISETYNPFENMSYSKMRKFAKVVQIYLTYKKIPSETKWQIDGLGVILFRDTENKIKGNVERIENIAIR